MATPLTFDVLHTYFYANPFAVALEQTMAAIQQQKFGLPATTYNQEPHLLNLEILRIKWVGVRTLEQLEVLLREKQAAIWAMAERFVGKGDTIHIGSSLRYLSYELIALTQDEEKITDFVRECVNEITFKKISTQLLKVYPKTEKKKKT